MPLGSRQLGLNDVDVALVVCPDLVAWRMRLVALTGPELAQDLERPAIQDVHDRGSSNVQKPLIRREGYAPRLKTVLAVEADKLLRDEFTCEREYLNPLVSAVGDIH